MLNEAAHGKLILGLGCLRSRDVVQRQETFRSDIDQVAAQVQLYSSEVVNTPGTMMLLYAVPGALRLVVTVRVALMRQACLIITRSRASRSSTWLFLQDSQHRSFVVSTNRQTRRLCARVD